MRARNFHRHPPPCGKENGPIYACLAFLAMSNDIIGLDTFILKWLHHRTERKCQANASVSSYSKKCTGRQTYFDSHRKPNVQDGVGRLDKGAHLNSIEVESHVVARCLITRSGKQLDGLAPATAPELDSLPVAQRSKPWGSAMRAKRHRQTYQLQGTGCR